MSVCYCGEVFEVRPVVGFHVRHLCECFAANVTFVRPFSSMNHHMLLQVAMVMKGGFAELTFILFRSGVQKSVLLQGPRRFVGFAANGAHVRMCWKRESKCTVFDSENTRWKFLFDVVNSLFTKK